MHVMIDLETMDTLPSAVILSVGVVPFDPKTGEVGEGAGIHIACDREEQERRWRTTSESTAAWWDRQKPEARAAWDLPKEDLWPVMDTMREISKYFRENRYVWSHGACFDVIILENLFKNYRVPLPWKFYDVRDTRTIYDLANVRVDRAEGVHHNALTDAIQQAKAVCDAYKKLGLV